MSAVSDLPKSFVLGGRTYTVELIAELRDPDSGERLFGCVQQGQSAIWIDAGLDPQFQWVVFWHELIHSMWHNAGIHTDHSEQHITALATQIQSILAQNGAKMLPIVPKEKK